MAPLRSIGNSLSSFVDFYARTGTDAVGAAPPGASNFASGGVISDYEDSGTFYRAHIFTSSGSLVTTEAITADILAVGGGGGSGRASGNGNFGGAGAGGMLTQTGVSIASGTTCPIVIGGGGSQFESTSGSGNYGGNGVDTAFTIPTGPTVYTAAGGGAGGGADASNGRPGGSGAGGGRDPSSGGTGSQYGPTSPLNPGPAPGQGNPGGTGSSGDNGAAGGGGAGASGSNGPAGDGGNGSPNVYAYGPASPVTYAGGGGAGVENGTTSGGTGGGGSAGGPIASQCSTWNSRIRWWRCRR